MSIWGFDMSDSQNPENQAPNGNQRNSRFANVAFAFLTAALLGGCDFQEDLVTLEIPTAPPQPFQALLPEEGPEVQPAEQEAEGPSRAFGYITAEDAIEICQGDEFFGDENVGTCLAPGGEGYYIWIDSDTVILVDRENPYLQSFQMAALGLDISQDTYLEKVRRWPVLIPLFFSVGTAGWTCGATVVSVISVVAAPTSPWWAGGCVVSLATFGVTAYLISDDAKTGARAFIESLEREADARYNYCRIEGGSDEPCRENAEGR